MLYILMRIKYLHSTFKKPPHRWLQYANGKQKYILRSDSNHK